LLPHGAHILSYYTPEMSAHYVAQARAALREHGLELDALPWPEQQAAADLLARMRKHEAYWMQLEYASAQPDILRLLFALARQDKVLIGLSGKYVRAGANAAWHIDLDALARQAAAMANDILRGIPPAKLPIAHPQRVHFIRAEQGHE